MNNYDPIFRPNFGVYLYYFLKQVSIEYVSPLFKYVYHSFMTRSHTYFRYLYEYLILLLHYFKSMTYFNLLFMSYEVLNDQDFRYLCTFIREIGSELIILLVYNTTNTPLLHLLCLHGIIFYIITQY